MRPTPEKIASLRERIALTATDVRQGLLAGHGTTESIMAIFYPCLPYVDMYFSWPLFSLELLNITSISYYEHSQITQCTLFKIHLCISNFYSNAC